MATDLPPWRLPDGVDAALWAYTASERLAAEEDQYFAGHPLHARDVAWAAETIGPTPRLVADLGCGAGRAALALARKGHRVLAVDLAAPMLRRLAAEAHAEGLPVLAVRAALGRLRMLPDACCDAALLLFSTLGMVRGREARRRALTEAARVVRPGGCLVLHAHNLWHNLRDPRGRRWLLGRAPGAILGWVEAGDRPMTYRGIPGLVVHQYRWGELRGDLRAGGWRVVRAEPIDAATALPIPAGWLLPRLRAGGWLVACRRGR